MNFDQVSIIFGGLGLVALLIIWRMHVADDWFDLRDVISERVSGGKVVSTSKVLLVAAFCMSAYWITRNYTETALGLFLAAWVVNGGIVAWRKTKQERSENKNATL